MSCGVVGGRRGTKRARERDAAGRTDERPGNPQLRRDGRMSGVGFFFERETGLLRRRQNLEPRSKGQTLVAKRFL